jgi:hypothetical protein
VGATTDSTESKLKPHRKRSDVIIRRRSSTLHLLLASFSALACKKLKKALSVQHNQTRFFVLPLTLGSFSSPLRLIHLFLAHFCVLILGPILQLAVGMARNFYSFEKLIFSPSMAACICYVTHGFSSARPRRDLRGAKARVLSLSTFSS